MIMFRAAAALSVISFLALLFAYQASDAEFSGVAEEINASCSQFVCDSDSDPESALPTPVTCHALVYECVIVPGYLSATLLGFPVSSSLIRAPPVFLS